MSYNHDETEVKMSEDYLMTCLKWIRRIYESIFITPEGSTCRNTQ